MISGKSRDSNKNPMQNRKGFVSAGKNLGGFAQKL